MCALLPCPALGQDHSDAANVSWQSQLVFLNGYTLPCLSHPQPLPLYSTSSFLFHSKTIKIRSKGLAVHVQNFFLNLLNCNQIWNRAGFFFFSFFSYYFLRFSSKILRPPEISHHERRKREEKASPSRQRGSWSNNPIYEVTCTHFWLSSFPSHKSLPEVRLKGSLCCSILCSP